MPVSIRGRMFKPSVFALCVALAACAGALSLGNWQMGRADEKRQAGSSRDVALIAPVRRIGGAGDLARYLDSRVGVEGRFDPGQTYFLDNRARDGRPGFEVVTPLKLAGSDAWVLVLRGWLAADAVRSDLPTVRTPAQEQIIEGLAIGRLSHALDPLGGAAQGRVRQNLTIEEFAAASGLRMLPFAIQQFSENGDGLQRNWPRPDHGADKHFAYALQWYSLGALALVLFLVVSFRRPPHAGS